jgi:hypothetical protein
MKQSSACRFMLFLAWLILRLWRRGRHIPPKNWLTFNGLHGVISQKIQLFVTTATRTSDAITLNVACLSYSSTPKMEAVRSSEKSVNFWHIVRPPSHKTVFFILTAVRASNLINWPWFLLAALSGSTIPQNRPLLPPSNYRYSYIPTISGNCAAQT